MAYTTYAAFVTATAEVSITGVSTALTSPPMQISTADLPLSYPRLPTLERESISFGSTIGLDSGEIEVVFLIEPIMQSLNSTTFSTMTTLIDAIDSAYATNAATIGIDRWSIRQETAVFGDTEYWSIVASVEASG